MTAWNYIKDSLGECVSVAAGGGCATSFTRMCIRARACSVKRYIGRFPLEKDDTFAPEFYVDVTNCFKARAPLRARLLRGLTTVALAFPLSACFACMPTCSTTTGTHTRPPRRRRI